MKHIKRAAALILAFAMSVSLVACGKDEPGAQSGEEQITLTIGIPNKVNVLDWEDNEFTKWLEAETGYNLEFYHFASNSGEAKSQLSTMMAGGEKLPDLILNLYSAANRSKSDVIGTYVYRMGLGAGGDAGMPRYSFGQAISLFTAVINITMLFIANKISNLLTGNGLW